MSKKGNIKSAGQLVPAHESGHADKVLMRLSRSVLMGAGFLLALFPSVIKMYETSHWFREGDDSKYDGAKEWFDNERLPFADAFESSKVLMRVYFFILPYFFSFFAIGVAKMIPQGQQVSTVKSESWLAVRSTWKRSIEFPALLVRLGWTKRSSLGEIVAVVAFLTVNVGTFAVRVRRSLPRGSRKLTFLVDDGDQGKVEIDPFSWQACEIWAKTLGIITMLNLGWYLLMPIGRRSVFLEALGLSWERAIKYHRWIGYYTVWLMFLHGVMYFAIYIHGDGHASYDPEGNMLRHNLVPWGCGKGDCDEDQEHLLRVNMYGIVALLLVLTMTCFALTYFRRTKFEWFYYVHHLFILVIFFVCLHYNGAIIYLIPGIAMYSVDKILGLLAYTKAGEVETKMVSSDVLELKVHLGQGVTYQAGQYVFLNVPGVSFLEWHPFSITSAQARDGDSHFSFHLKAAGSWTKDVIAAASKASGDSFLKVRFDGFYGHDVKSTLVDKQAVIFVGGGIGVTPMLSLALEVCETHPATRVTLLWVVRTVDEFKIFSDTLFQAQQRYGDGLTVKVWITLSLAEPTAKDEEASVVQLDKEDMMALDEKEQSERVIALLQQSNFGGDEQPTSSPVPFVMDNGGMSPAVSAFVSMLVVLVGLSGFALSQWLNNKNEIEPADKLTLVDLALVFGFVLVMLALVEMSRRLAKRLSAPTATSMKTPSSQQCLPSTAHDSSSSSSSQHKDTNESSSTDSIDEENKQQIWSHMITGRIGCRPMVRQEFQSVVEQVASTEESSHPLDIGVLACGPAKLVQSVNDICNKNTTASFPWGFRINSNDDNHNKDGTTAFFSFTEEDWAW